MSTHGRATPEGTNRFASRSKTAAGHFRQALQGRTLSSIGLGTYLGEEDEETDRGYEASVAVALGSGVNVFDTAINYRGQRSERAIGRALASAFAEGIATREELFVSTKGGFLSYDVEDPREPMQYVREEYFDSGLLHTEEIAAGCHAMVPAYLRDQIDRSRRNLGLETIDLYYLHNPETQLKIPDHGRFAERLRAAVETLEQAAADGKIGGWGLATWDGLRVPPHHPDHLALADVLAAAREIAGDLHHFQAIQAPLNIVMAQAIAYPSQMVGGRPIPLLAAADELGLAFFSSASLLQGRLAQADLPAPIETLFTDVPSGPRRALQFPRSASGVTAALVGCSNPEHARETFALSAIRPAPGASLAALFG
jgi:aryl-alcohol dehydrogenase-like predicted oxidoreductase